MNTVCVILPAYSFESSATLTDNSNVCGTLQILAPNIHIRRIVRSFFVENWHQIVLHWTNNDRRSASNSESWSPTNNTRDGQTECASSMLAVQAKKLYFPD